jgi:hypothetical protein
VGITVLLRRRGWGGWKVGLLLDLSISGAHIEVEPSAFPLHTILQLEATPPGTGVTGLMRCRAMVIRRATGSIGVAFEEIAPPGLAPLLRRRASAAAARP